VGGWDTILLGYLERLVADLTAHSGEESEAARFSKEQPGWRREMQENSEAYVVCWAEEGEFTVHSTSEDRSFVRKGAASMIERLWIMCMIGQSLCSGCMIDFASSSGCLACTNAFPGRDPQWVFGHFNTEIARILTRVDVANCECRWSEQRADIMSKFEEMFGGVERFTVWLNSASAGPVLRNAAEHNDAAAIQELCSRLPELRLNSARLCGDLGETAVHIATATGSCEALSMLLQLGMDPNASDLADETPMHYAALTGQTQCARILLRYGTHAGGLSSMVERPLDVAKYNLAAFLGVDTREVQQLLEAQLAANPQRGNTMPHSPCGRVPPDFVEMAKLLTTDIGPVEKCLASRHARLEVHGEPRSEVVIRQRVGSLVQALNGHDEMDAIEVKILLSEIGGIPVEDMSNSHPEVLSLTGIDIESLVDRLCLLFDAELVNAMYERLDLAAAQ